MVRWRSGWAVPARLAAQALARDLWGYALTPGLSASVSGELLAVEWEGAGATASLIGRLAVV